MKRIAQIGILAAFSFAAAYASPLLIPLSGGPVVSGAPGSIVGWGYQIVNDTGFFLFIDNSAFCGPGGDPQLTVCDSPYNGVTNFGPALGTYMDFIANNLTIIAPNSTATQDFDSASMSGIGEYMINPAAAPGATDPATPATQTSNLFITFQEYDGYPFAGGSPGFGRHRNQRSRRSRSVDHARAGSVAAHGLRATARLVDGGPSDPDRRARPGSFRVPDRCY